MESNAQALSSDPGPRVGYETLAAEIAIELARVNRLAQDSDVWKSLDHEGVLRELLVRLNQVLEDHHIEYRDHTGQPWVEGLPLTVVHVRGNVSDPVIVETLRPSIAMSNQIISHGYVVIGDQSEAEQAE